MSSKLCIEVTPPSKIAFISEELCIGCSICVKKCPFEAIQIINLCLEFPSQRFKKTPCLEYWKVEKDTMFMICSAASLPASKQKIHVVVLLYLCFISVVTCYFLGCL